MSITYSWLIDTLDIAPAVGELTNVVRKIHWRLIATDGDYTTDVYGDTPLSEADSETFTTYENLDEATVIHWLEAAIDERAGDEEDTVAAMRTGLAGTLAAMRTPAIVSMPLPW
jgi:hypothetical protein